MDFAVQMLATGVGDPAFFNDELIAAGLRDHGVTAEDVAQLHELHLRRDQGRRRLEHLGHGALLQLPAGAARCDGRGRRGRAARAGDVRRAAGAGAERIWPRRSRRAAARPGWVWRERERPGGFPLASCLIDDCLARGLDFDRGGARYNWVENSFVGLANLADSLVAVQPPGLRAQELSLAEFATILPSDFDGHETAAPTHPERAAQVWQRHRRGGRRSPAEWAGFLIDDDRGQTDRAAPLRAGLLLLDHARAPGQRRPAPRPTGAGRAGRWPTARARRRAARSCGPTASVLSTTTWTHRGALGGLVHNAKFSARVLRTGGPARRCAPGRDVPAARRLRDPGQRRRRGDARDAQAHPEHYRDLLVRVAGYSDYFVHLTPEMQEEVIARTTSCSADAASQSRT